MRFLVTSEITPIESHQCDFPNVTGTRMTPIKMSKQKGKVHMALTLHRFNSQLRKTGWWPSPGKSTQIVHHQMISSENMETNYVVQTEKVMFSNMYACTYVYMHVITINEKEAINLEPEGRFIGDFESTKGNREML